MRRPFCAIPPQKYSIKLISTNDSDSSVARRIFGVGAIAEVYGDRMSRVAEAVAATALGYGSEAWARILAAADQGVVARLLGLMAVVSPGWVRKGVAEVI